MIQKIGLSESKHETHFMTEKRTAFENELATYKKNVQIFKKAVQQDINQMVDSHIKQVKRLTNIIEKQNKIIKEYENKYGKLNNNNQKTNVNFQSQPPSPSYSHPDVIFNKISNRQNLNRDKVINQLKNTPSPNLDKFINEYDELLETPPDQIYTSKFGAKNINKKKTQHELYKSLKSDKHILEANTKKLHQLVGLQIKNNNNKSMYNQEQEQQSQIESPKIKSMKKLKMNNNEQPLNASLSFIYDSVDRIHNSRSKSKKKKPTQKKAMPNINPQTLGLMQKRRLNTILRQMRQKINTQNQTPVQQIKQSKLLTVGHGESKNTKVMINPTPIDLSKKIKAGGQVPSPKLKQQQLSGILKKASTIEGLSSISNYTRQSSPSKSFNDYN